MATDTKNLCSGPATLSIGAYVAAGANGTLVDVGHTSGPAVLTIGATHHETSSERAYGKVQKKVASYDVKLQVPMLEVTSVRFRQALRQPSGNVSGTLPDQVFLIGDPENGHTNGLYLGLLQIKLETIGPVAGSSPSGTRTAVFYKCAPDTVGGISFGKEVDQMFDVTFDVLYDDSVSTNDKFGKVTDA